MKLERHLMHLGQMINFGTQLQPKNSHWFSGFFSRSCGFLGTDVLVSFEASSTDLYCVGGSMEQYLLQNHQKPEMKVSSVNNTSRDKIILNWIFSGSLNIFKNIVIKYQCYINKRLWLGDKVSGNKQLYIGNLFYLFNNFIRIMCCAIFYYKINISNSILRTIRR